MDKKQFTDLVMNGLERTLFEGVYGLPQNFVIFELNSKYYVQIAAGRGGLTARCEAVGNAFLEPGDLINENQVERLLQLGWSAGSKRENHGVELPCESIEDRQKLAELFYTTAEIYGATAIANVEVHIG